MLKKRFSVSQLNRYISSVLASDVLLNAVTVSGEISGYKKYPSGHAYFTLKDDTAKLSCVMFRSNARRYDAFEEGTALELSGYINVYERDGRYQLIVNSVKLTGAGEFYRRYIALKEALAKAGYFDEARKRPLPKVKRVGLITSAQGAAIEDFLSILKQRDPSIAVDVYPSLVQGERAVDSLIRAMDYFNKRATVDIIVLTRGGGSIEDLWCFNDRRLAEAIFHSTLPVLAAIGHEVDVSIAEFVADARAATPSAAATLISQAVHEKKRQLDDVFYSMSEQLKTVLHHQRKTLAHYALQRWRHVFSARRQRAAEQLETAWSALSIRQSHRLAQQRQLIESTFRHISALNPQRQLEKGYAIISTGDGLSLGSVKQVQPGQALSVRMIDGTIETTINEVTYEKPTN